MRAIPACSRTFNILPWLFGSKDSTQALFEARTVDPAFGEGVASRWQLIKRPWIVPAYDATSFPSAQPAECEMIDSGKIV